MKTTTLQYMITFIGLMLSVVSVFMVNDYMNDLHSKKDPMIAILNNTTRKKTSSTSRLVEELIINEVVPEETTVTTTTTVPVTKTPELEIGSEVVYESLTLNELTDKLNKNLGSNLEGTGSYFASYTQKTGLDPYLALAIVLHETGCKWGCSKLVKDCNNIGGIKGTPSCNGGAYKAYESLESGINGYLDLIYNNYYSIGLNTPELINPKYAASPAWAEAINRYINTIRNS